VFVCFLQGEKPCTPKIKTFISQTQARRLQSRQNSLVFFLVCLFFTLAISWNFSSSFSTAAPPGGSREQHMVSSNIVMALNLFKSLLAWDRVRHIVYLRSFLVKSQQSTHHLVVHTPISRIFFLPFGSATWRPLIEHYNFLLFT